MARIINDTKTKIYVANLGKYVEGYLVGEWIDLPFTEDEFEEMLKRIEIDGKRYEEYAIHDFETDIDGLKIGEYTNILKLNEQIEALEDLDGYEFDIAVAAIEFFGYDITDVVGRIDDFYLSSDIENDYDLGYYNAEECGYIRDIENSPLSNYIDYEAFGRDIRLEASGGYSSRGYIEERS